ncbi:hypothetical protein JGH11_18810 [Dysgonomonas sp. Marseille-P4677]|uniref:hypothetical protein n=1 Tax=Dysgonomonas sp. Marseille-P4677 TaxID=2364790 RepID=UPI0019116383|nr:hypothetical protein [Dysgonomonas sp. Marseille-P4677]MBK5722924.1 hypothetical protein [Dysgonomonas sp. Marseille-P4677]
METLVKINIKSVDIDTICGKFSEYVYEFDNIGVIDFEYYNDYMRVFVDFVFCLVDTDIKCIEILDSDYEQIRTIEALQLENRLRNIVSEYNKSKMTDEQKAAEIEYRNMIMFERF